MRISRRSVILAVVAAHFLPLHGFPEAGEPEPGSSAEPKVVQQKHGELARPGFSSRG